MIKLDLTDLTSADPKVKYGCARNLLTVAKENPAELYPDFTFYAKLLDSENNILKWTAIDVLGYLAKVDEAKQIDKQLEKLFALLDTGNLITAVHAMTALADIALAKPAFQKRITVELLKVAHYKYATVECSNIANGKVILAFGAYFDKLTEREGVLSFVRRQTKNSRNATKKKAEQFLRKYDK